MSGPGVFPGAPGTNQPERGGNESGPGASHGSEGASVVVRAPAKVNLFLRVLAREASGYHQIETLFQALDLHDTVRVEHRPDPGVELEVVASGPSGRRGQREAEEAEEGSVERTSATSSPSRGLDDLGPEEENLAYRAAVAYLERAGLGGTSGLRIRLEKTIPAGAGMGGGSSDAAAVLRALDALHPGGLDPGRLLSVGAGLGSDVPFFLGPEPLALGWGRGDRLLGLPSLESRAVVVVVPDWQMPTAEAYGRLATRDPRSGSRGRGATALTLAEMSSWDGIARRAVNDFEEVVFQDRPEGREILETLSSSGGVPALLSGSGSAAFGVFDSKDSADDAADRLAADHPRARIFRTATLAAWHPVAPAGPGP